MGPPESRCSDDSDKVLHFHSTQAVVDFPKIIWFLWLQGLENSPPIVTACRDSWLKNNPTWDFRFVTHENLGTYSGIDLASFDHLEKSQLADLIRLDLLLKHGGVWVDATCFCINDLESWLPAYMKSGFFAFEKPGRDRAISSWFLASTPNNALIKSLHSQLTRYLSNPKLSMRRGILEQLLKINLRTTSLWFTPIVVNILRVYPYFAFHYMFAKVVRKEPQCAAVWTETPRLSANIPIMLQNNGLFTAMEPTVRREIDERRAPLYKLTWKYDPAELSDDCTLAYLLHT